MAGRNDLMKGIMNGPSGMAGTVVVFEPDPQALYSLETAARLGNVSRRRVLLYYKYGLLAPVVDQRQGSYLFDAECIRALRRIEYLRAVCGDDLVGIRMILNLVDEVERLRDEKHGTEGKEYANQSTAKIAEWKTSATPVRKRARERFRFPRNVGGWDRGLRAAGMAGAVAAGLLARLAPAWRGMLFGVAAAQAFTVVARYCPLNQALGINSARPKSRRGRANTPRFQARRRAGDYMEERVPPYAG